jgi:hypothetical protein
MGFIPLGGKNRVVDSYEFHIAVKCVLFIKDKDNGLKICY